MERAPSIYTISPHRGFADVLAAELLLRAEGRPEALARMRVLLPSRRAIRAVTDAFLKATEGKPMLLPSMQAVGDVDEEELVLMAPATLDIPPAISASRRLLLLATLIWRFQQKEYGAYVGFDQAVQLASQLADLIDEVQREEKDVSNLETLVTGELAAHWQITVDFLRIIILQWPDILAEEGRLDPVDHRNRLLEWQAAQWREHPPAYPVIAAGTTGSTPATARLLAVIAGLPQGMVVLPGLDTQMPDAEWKALDETHPQWGMSQLLSRLKVSRQEVWELGANIVEGGDEQSPRVKLLKTALCPARHTDGWRQASVDWGAGIKGCTRLDCATIQHEATTVALLLRDALEIPARTAALITPNRELARRVAAILQRFNVEIDDSAGIPLGRTPGGIFLQSVLEVVEERAAPVGLLSLLKHPLAQLGMPLGEVRHLTHQIEVHALRGVRHSDGLSAIANDSKIASKKELREFIERVASILKPLEQAMEMRETPFGALLSAHISVAEALSTRDDGRIGLWEGQSGEALQDFLHELVVSADKLPDIPSRSYAAIIRALLQGRAWRPTFGLHPRLHILSPMEGRLQRFDRVVLAGLNEGCWPADVGQDPWMSRPMRKDFGLPQPEQRIGLSAHDFYSLAASGEVYLTRAEKEGGAATVPSRWLLRLEALLGTLGGSDARRLWVAEGVKWRGWAAHIDAANRIAPCKAPAPTPPVEARPRTLYATHIEKLLRNPYAIYASHILGLRALDPLDKEPGALEFGNLVHAALEAYVNAGEQGEEALLAHGRRVLEPLADRPGVAALWWPRFTRIAVWVAAFETESCPEVTGRRAEIEVATGWEAPAGPFSLRARLDRYEVLKDGSVRIIDYKTGLAFKDLDRGLSCQLLLAGAIEWMAGKALADLQYWELKGVREESRCHRLSKLAPDGAALEQWAVEIFDKTRELLALYDDAATPYLHCPVAADAPTYNDYEHLARPQEWEGEV